MTTSKVTANSELSFENTETFVGLDVHKKSWKVTCCCGSFKLIVNEELISRQSKLIGDGHVESEKNLHKVELSGKSYCS